jgi:hypothetical protein
MLYIVRTRTKKYRPAGYFRQCGKTRFKRVDFPTPALPGSGSMGPALPFTPSQPGKTQHPFFLFVDILHHTTVFVNSRLTKVDVYGLFMPG